MDFDADGSEVFDLWRLRWYGLSLPEPLTSRMRTGSCSSFLAVARRQRIMTAQSIAR
ncbi:hypothetical protein [Streptomyces virginiae]|uniref:hypothetical protein n=1 Tax=Streptomyces virginiae TaxID=1961 RepID=UPI0036A0268F